MYDTILLTLDNSAADRPIIEHVKALASKMGSQVVLLHVASGPTAQFQAENAGGEEVEQARAYLETVRNELSAGGINATVALGYGEPASEIVKWIKTHPCDLLAMGTHGHKLIGDFFLGKTAIRVQHEVQVPVLLLKVS